MKQYRRRMEARSRHLTGAGGVGGAEGAGEVGELEPSPHWKTEGIDGRSSMSEIASCSYEARAVGVKNGMFLGPALSLCPDLATIPYDFPAYEEVSRSLYDTVAAYTLDIQVGTS